MRTPLRRYVSQYALRSQMFTHHLLANSGWTKFLATWTVIKMPSLHTTSSSREANKIPRSYRYGSRHSSQHLRRLTTDFLGLVLIRWSCVEACHRRFRRLLGCVPLVISLFSGLFPQVESDDYFLSFCSSCTLSIFTDQTRIVSLHLSL